SREGRPFSYARGLGLAAAPETSTLGRFNRLRRRRILHRHGGRSQGGDAALGVLHETRPVTAHALHHVAVHRKARAEEGIGHGTSTRTARRAGDIPDINPLAVHPT